MITSSKVIIFTDRQTAAARKKWYQRIEIAPIIFKYVDGELVGLFPFGPSKELPKSLRPQHDQPRPLSTWKGYQIIHTSLPSDGSDGFTGE